MIVECTYFLCRMYSRYLLKELCNELSKDEMYKLYKRMTNVYLKILYKESFLNHKLIETYQLLYLLYLRSEISSVLDRFE